MHTLLARLIFLSACPRPQLVTAYQSFNHWTTREFWAVAYQRCGKWQLIKERLGPLLVSRWARRGQFPCTWCWPTAAPQEGRLPAALPTARGGGGGHSRTSLQTHQLPAIHYTSDISAADWGLFLQAWGWVSTGLLSGAAQQVWSRQKRAWHNELPQRHLRFCHPNMHAAMFSKEPLVLCMKIRYLEITTWSLWVFIAPHVLVAAKTFGEQR